jgi:hypothetical protein
MFTRISIAATIVLAAAVWGASLWFFGVNLAWEYTKPFSFTLAAVTAILTAFDLWLWCRWPCRWFHSMPYIGGIWKAELHSSYVDPNTGARSDPVTGTAIIAQTFSSISIRLKTDSARSFLIAERLVGHSDGAYDVIGVYQSDPEIHLRGSVSEIHYGAFRYHIAGNPPTELKGHYWTDRNTSGSIRLTPEAARSSAASPSTSSGS